MAGEADGTVTKAGEGVYDLRFERRYGLPIDTVWAALTEPARLADWLALATLDLRVGGAIVLDWPEMGDRLDGVIVALDPPRLLAFTWSEPDGAPGSVVRWELSEEPDGCRLLMDPHPGQIRLSARRGQRLAHDPGRSARRGGPAPAPALDDRARESRAGPAARPRRPLPRPPAARGVRGRLGGVEGLSHNPPRPRLDRARPRAHKRALPTPDP